MKFGKIDYLNLLPFYVFLKKYKAPSRFKMYAFNKKSYPSKINSLYKRGEIDAAFISSIVAKNQKGALDIGIVAKKEIMSVIVEIDKKSEIDFHSQTSNELAKILEIEGRVSIGDKALRIYIDRDDSVIDLAEAWHQKYRLPFVFARLCCNRDIEFYRKMSKAFVRKKVKIPYYIIKRESIRKNIPIDIIKIYLDKVSYEIGIKEKRSLKKFYDLAGRKKRS